MAMETNLPAAEVSAHGTFARSQGRIFTAGPVSGEGTNAGYHDEVLVRFCNPDAVARPTGADVPSLFLLEFFGGAK